MKPDVNHQSFVRERDRMVTAREWENPPDDGKAYDDVFKASDCHRFGARGITIAARKSREDALDCVRGSDYLFEDCEIQGSITAKGAIDGFMVRRCVVERVMEFGQFDNYWYPGRPPTKNIHIDTVWKTDYRPCHVVLWDAETPDIARTNALVRRVPKAVWLPYFLFRYLANGNRSRIKAMK